MDAVIIICEGVIDVANTSARGGTLTAQANSAKLRDLRGERKQKEIERGCGIPSGQLTRFETGKPVGIKYLIKLADFYSKLHGVHIAPAELLSEKGLSTTGELLTDLATLRGVKIDFSSSNGDNGNSNKEQQFAPPQSAPTNQAEQRA